MSKLTHLDSAGRVKMVDVGDKPDTRRVAIARGQVTMQPDTLDLIREGMIRKGDVLAVAQVAGIMAAKRTSELIPLCHPIPISSIHVELSLDDELSCVSIEARAQTTGKTGVEMEALVGVLVALLTIWEVSSI